MSSSEARRQRRAEKKGAAVPASKKNVRELGVAVAQLADIVNTSAVFGGINDVAFDVERIPEDLRDKTLRYSTQASVGFDIAADVPADAPLTVDPGKIIIVPTALYLTDLQEDFEIQIRPRSGLAAKRGVTVLNTPGTIDPDYRDEIRIILINHGSETVTINRGDRIAQGVFNRIYRPHHGTEGFNLPEDEDIREGGFGSTGV